MRDPHVRLKIGGRVYDRTLALVTDPVERAAVLESKTRKYPRQRIPTTSSVSLLRVLPGSPAADRRRHHRRQQRGRAGRLVARRGRPRRGGSWPRSAPSTAARALGPLPSGASRVARISYADPATLEAAFRRAAAVIHLAGILVERPGSTYDEANVATTRGVVAAAKRSGVPRLVFASAVGADPGATNRYWRSKGEAEGAVRTSGLAYAILRLPLLLGRGTEGAAALPPSPGPRRRGDAGGWPRAPAAARRRGSRAGGARGHRSRPRSRLRASTSSARSRWRSVSCWAGRRSSWPGACASGRFPRASSTWRSRSASASPGPASPPTRSR